MRPLWATVLLGGLLLGCAAAPDDAGEVEVEGLVLEDDAVTDAAWRDPGGGVLERGSSGAPAAAADLADGFATGGLTWSLVDGEWVEASSRVLDRQEPAIAADVRLASPDGPDGDDEARDLACEVTIEAPVDRGVAVDGELTVTLVATDGDGREATQTAARWRLDLGLAAGERATARTGQLGTVADAEPVGLRCQVDYAPS